MYSRINKDVHSDIELVLKYLTAISHKVNWNDDGVFNRVLSMRDKALKAAERITVTENPKWDRIAKILKRAALSGKWTGIFKVGPDPVPFWKQPQIVDGQSYFIDLQ